MKMWTLTDVTTLAVYTFPTNPNQMGPILNPKQLESLPHYSSPRTWKTGTMPNEWTFGGISYTQTSYDDLVDWMGRKHELEVNDHLSRVFRFLPKQVLFTEVRSRKHPWKHTYEVRGLLTVQYGGGLG